MAKKNASLAAIQQVVKGPDGYDVNGMGENMATLGRARDEEDQFYRNALATATPGLNAAVTMQQQGGTMMQDDGMKVFLQALHEKNAKVGRSLDLPNSPVGQPSTYDPSFQTSAVDPNAGRQHRVAVDMRAHPDYYGGQAPSLAAISKVLNGKKAQV